MTPEQSFNTPISPETLALISGRELFIEHLGYWPTFHDFEVLSITLDRAVVSATIVDLRAIFLIFDTNKTPTDRDRKQGTAEFLFESLDELRIDGFNHQNPIMALSITLAEPFGKERRFRVAWGGTCLRHEVSFTCSRITVLRVVDLNPFRRESRELFQ